MGLMYTLGALPLVQGAGGQDAARSFAESWNRFMLEEVSDARVWQIPFLGTEVHLPQWPPIHLGALVIDLSPTKHVMSLLTAAALLAVVMIWTARRTHGKGAHRAPSGLANMIEAFVIFLRDEVALRGIGKGGERYVPFVLTLFFFILFMNFMGLLPFGATPTGNIAVTAGLAFISLVVIEIGGFLHLGPAGYSKTILVVPEGLPWFMKVPMGILMAFIELLAKAARIFALAIRLFANMLAGHVVIFALIGLIFLAGMAGGLSRWIGSVAPALMVVGVMMLEILVAFIQAYIFAMLTSVFIGLVRHPH